MFSLNTRTDEVKKKTTPVEAAIAAAVPATPVAPFSAQSAAEAAFLVGDEYNEITTNLMEMGFSREMVKHTPHHTLTPHTRASLQICVSSKFPG